MRRRVARHEGFDGEHLVCCVALTCCPCRRFQPAGWNCARRGKAATDAARVGEGGAAAERGGPIALVVAARSGEERKCTEERTTKHLAPVGWDSAPYSHAHGFSTSRNWARPQNFTDDTADPTLAAWLPYQSY